MTTHFDRINMWRRKRVKSLFSLSFDATLKDISLFGADNNLQYLPLNIKDQLLKSLSVNNSFWRMSNFKSILKMLTHSKLEIIDITSAPLDDDILKILSSCVELQRIYLIRDGKYHISKQALLNFIQCQKQLERLQLRNCDIVDDSVLKCISVTCLKIDSLDIKGCKEITDEGLNYLSALKNLKNITLSKTKITNNGLIDYIKGSNGRTLKELIIDNCIHINMKGIMEVPKYCPNLEIFVFYNCDCSEAMEMQNLEQNALKNLKQLTWTVSW